MLAYEEHPDSIHAEIDSHLFQALFAEGTLGRMVQAAF